MQAVAVGVASCRNDLQQVASAESGDNPRIVLWVEVTQRLWFDRLEEPIGAQHAVGVLTLLLLYTWYTHSEGMASTIGAGYLVMWHAIELLKCWAVQLCVQFVGIVPKLASGLRRI